MRYKIKYIILSRLLLIALIVPPLWQLEHTFFNNHGVVYQQNTNTVHKIFDNSCAPLHQQFQFHSVFSIFIYQTLEIDFSAIKNCILPSKPYVFSIRTYGLRAPPVNT